MDRPTCAAGIGLKAGPYGMEPIVCAQSVGVRTYHSPEGVVGYCAIPRHEAKVRRRYLEVDPPEPKWLHEDCPPWCPDKAGGDHDHTDPFVDHPANATVETEYATYWTTGTDSAA